MSAPNEQRPPTEAEDRHESAAKLLPQVSVPHGSATPVDELHALLAAHRRKAEPGPQVELDVEPVRPDQVALDDYRQHLADVGRDAGLESAERNDPDWSARVFDWVLHLEPGVEFDADDVRTNFGASGAVGAVFRKASKHGLIVCIGMSESRSITRHKSLQRRWVRT